MTPPGPHDTLHTALNVNIETPWGPFSKFRSPWPSRKVVSPSEGGYDLIPRWPLKPTRTSFGPHTPATPPTRGAETACLLLAGPPAAPNGVQPPPTPSQAGWDLTWALVLTTLTSRAAPGPASSPEPYQHIDPREGVVRVVQGVDQLIHPIAGLAVPVETNTHGSTMGKTPNELRGDTRELF